MFEKMRNGSQSWRRWMAKSLKSKMNYLNGIFKFFTYYIQSHVISKIHNHFRFLVDVLFLLPRFFLPDFHDIRYFCMSFWQVLSAVNVSYFGIYGTWLTISFVNFFDSSLKEWKRDGFLAINWYFPCFQCRKFKEKIAITFHSNCMFIIKE